MQLPLNRIYWLGLACAAFMVSCARPQSTENPAPEPTPDATESGTLALVANGEDFVRQGFTTKDGWRIDFDRVAVTLANIEAYQTEPAFDPDSGETPQASVTVPLVETPKIIDLAAGDAEAEPIFVTEKSAPPGFYNALAWQLVTNEDGHSIVIVGMAQKDTREIAFTLNFDTQLAYICGEYVGDDRKGILASEGSAELEATFHFDHIFGDGEAPAEDDINTGALGFEPLAQLANGNTLNIDTSALEASLAPAEYETLEKALTSLGHVGEGHCRQENVES